MSYQFYEFSLPYWMLSIDAFEHGSGEVPCDSDVLLRPESRPDIGP